MRTLELVNLLWQAMNFAVIKLGFYQFGKQCIIARDIYIFSFFFSFDKFANISSHDAALKPVIREIETVILNTINPMNSKKCVTTFSWIFHFSLIDFSSKIYNPRGI